MDMLPVYNSLDRYRQYVSMNGLQDNKRNMKMFDIQIKARVSTTKRLRVNDQTTRVLSNGKRIPTWSKMQQLASKI